MIGRSAQKHILIIDDDDAIKFMLENQIFKQGFKVSIAANGPLAISKMKANIKYDLIVCDLKASGLEGLEFLSEARKMGIETPVLIMTSNKNTVALAIEQEICSVIVKPFNPSDLITKITALLEPAFPNKVSMAA